MKHLFKIFFVSIFLFSSSVYAQPSLMVGGPGQVPFPVIKAPGDPSSIVINVTSNPSGSSITGTNTAVFIGGGVAPLFTAAIGSLKSPVCIGTGTCAALTTAGSIVAIGENACAALSVNGESVCIGNSAGSSNTGGITAIGQSSCLSSVTASPTCVGLDTGKHMGASANGLLLGTNAAYGLATTPWVSSDLVAVGNGALYYYTGDGPGHHAYNTVVGDAAFSGNTSGNSGTLLTGIGSSVGASCSSCYAIFVGGSNALINLTTGHDILAIGPRGGGNSGILGSVTNQSDIIVFSSGGACDTSSSDVFLMCSTGGTFLSATGIGTVATSTMTVAGNLVVSGTLSPKGTANWTANGSVATILTSLGPSGSHTTVQEWLTVVDTGGTTRYIPTY